MDIVDIRGNKGQFKQYLGSNMRTVEAKLKAISEKDSKALIENISEVMGSPEVANCSMESILSCCIDLIRVGLPLNKLQGYAYVVPFRGQATATISYKGWLLLLKEVGIKVRAEAVYSCDIFEYIIDGFDTILNLYPALDKREEDNNSWCMENLKGVALWVKDGGDTEKYFITKEKLLQITGKQSAILNKDKSARIYQEWFIEMMKAKAIKYIASKMPIYNDTNFKDAINIDSQEAVALQRVTPIDDSKFDEEEANNED